MKEGDLINGTTSKCCNASVSKCNGKITTTGELIPPHWLCNKCKKQTEIIVKPMWVITDKLKYKEINH